MSRSGRTVTVPPPFYTVQDGPAAAIHAAGWIILAVYEGTQRARLQTLPAGPRLAKIQRQTNPDHFAHTAGSTEADGQNSSYLSPSQCHCTCLGEAWPSTAIWQKPSRFWPKISHQSQTLLSQKFHRFLKSKDTSVWMVKIKYVSWFMRSPMHRRALLPPDPIPIPTCAANVSPQLLPSDIVILCTLLALLSLVESQTKTD